MARLDGGGETMLLALRDGPPVLAYWGPALPDGVDAAAVAALTPPPRAGGGMLDGGEAFDLFPEAGRGFTGHPALELCRASGDFVTQLGFREARPIDDGWAILLADAEADVELELRVSLDSETGVAAFRSRLVNRGRDALHLDWMAPAALPLAHDEVVLFDGRWAREFQPVRQRLATGLIVKENRTGRTSHHAPPFAVVGEPGFGEAAGAVLGLHLAWSGNARLVFERLRDGVMQAQAGELFLPGEVTLAAGEAYVTPILYAARSDAGLNGLSDRLHPFVRRQILGGRLAGKPRPVNFNTWEAVYFRHDLAELKALAELAASVGAERFVLDDGWFEGRDDDTTSLGDWRADPRKYPDGLGPLIEHMRGLGLEFGLWVEPEMANARSKLLAEHPDWTLHAGARVQPLGRGQYVLDLTRPEVAEAIFAQLDALLAAHPIGYLKWDMNRDLTHAASLGRPASHRQTLAVYALIDRLRAAHPGVEIESCASGGGRADYEILRRTERIWTSDNNDALDRQAIQRGFGVFFPPEVMGAHVGPSPSHTTGRRLSLAFRAWTAVFGHLGIEADIRDFTEAERARLAQIIGIYKQHRGLLHGGRTARLETADPTALAFMVANEAGVLVSYAQLATPTVATPAPLRLPTLDPGADYRMRLLTPARRAPLESAVAPGQLLATMGLPLPALRAAEIAVFHLERL
ncbi:MAG TPA: alpha-galactosidase [Caulobacteraceae bacterium]